MPDPDTLIGPRAYGDALLTGRFKSRPEDFLVSEHLTHDPSGEGGFLWLKLRKCGENTAWLARELADAFQLAQEKVSYAGLKDRQALTDQWFAVETDARDLPKRWLDDHPTVELLDQSRHGSGLRRHDVSSNTFHITLRDVVFQEDAWAARLEQISTDGVPNYFGPQRFGLQGENVEKARAMFKGQRVEDRFLRGMYLSAVRSFLFNAVLGERVHRGDWQGAIRGEALIEAKGGGRLILPWNSMPAIAQIDAWKAHPTGPLVGPGRSDAKFEAFAVEKAVLSEHQSLLKGLEKHRMRSARRSLRMRPANFAWELDDGNLKLRFALGAGEYATSVLREIGAF